MNISWLNQLVANFRGPGSKRRRQRLQQTLRSNRRRARIGMQGFEALEDRRVLAAGDLDLTFDTDGKVTTDFGASTTDTVYIESLAVQADGKILVVGTSNQDFALARYNTNGTLDATFDTDGKVTTPFGAAGDNGVAVAVQSDGKILVGGSTTAGTFTQFAVARYNTNGSLDTSFDTDGKVTTAMGTNFSEIASLAVQADGKILAAGYSSNDGAVFQFAVARYNTNGSLDTSFDGDGQVTTFLRASANYDYALSTVVQADGKIVVAGASFNGANDDFGVVRYNANGSLDTTFDGDGKFTANLGSGANPFDTAYSVALQSDGKIVVAGAANTGVNNDFAVIRLNTNGSFDATFDTDGIVTTPIGTSSDTGYAVAIQTDGKILVAGDSVIGGPLDFSLVRYNTNGSLDTTFSTDGKVTTSIGTNDTGYAVALQSDGKILVAGVSGSPSDFALVRYQGDPVAPATTFNYETVVNASTTFTSSAVNWSLTGNMANVNTASLFGSPLSGNASPGTNGYMDTGFGISRPLGNIGGVGVPSGSTFRAVSFDVWPSSDMGNNVYGGTNDTLGTVGLNYTVIGKLNGSQVVSANVTDSARTPPQSGSAPGGYWHHLDLSATAFATTNIDTVEFVLVAQSGVPMNYLAVDNFGYNNLVVATSSLSAALDGSNNLVIADTDGTKNNNLTIVASGSNYVITDTTEQFASTGGISGAVLSNGNKTLTVPIASITGTQVIISGAGGNDQLTVDVSGGGFAKAIAYNGGTGGNDSLVLTGGSTTSQTFNYINSFDGSVVLAGTIAGTVNYTGLDPITSTINATNVILNYGVTSETITVTTAGAGQTTVASTAGETTTFNNPTALLEINAGDGDDTITVNSVGSGFAAALTIDGQNNNDAINLNAAGLSVTTLNLTAETIAQTQGVTASGTTTLNAGAAGSITLTNTSNAFATVSVTNAGTASLLDDSGFDIGASTISTLLTVSSTSAISQSGAIGGAGGLVKQGAGTYTLTNFNTFTGGTTVNAGKLLLGAGGAVGTIRGTVTVNAGATLDYTVANTFGFNVGQSVNVLNIVGGTVGGADFNNHFWNNFQLNMTGGTLHLGGAQNEFHNPTITVNAAATTAQILPVTGAAVLRLRDGTSGLFNVANSALTDELLVSVPIVQHTTDHVTMSGTGQLLYNAASSAFSNLYLSGGTFVIGGSGTHAITNLVPGAAIADGARATGNGVLNIQGTVVVNSSSLSINNQSSTIGTVNQSGGTLNISGSAKIGHWPGGTGNYNLSSGALNLTGTPGGVVNPVGTPEQDGILYLGVDGAGVFTQTGGTVSAHGVVLDARNDSGGTDTLTLNGGTMTLGASGIKTGSLDANTSYQINLGGGTLRASADWTSSRNATLTNAVGPAIVDTNGFNIGLSGVLSGVGGSLRKQGAGTATLTGINTYSGGTTVDASSGSVIATVNTTQNSLGTGAVSVGASSTVRLNNTNTTGGNVTIGNTFTGSGLLNLVFAANATAKNTIMQNVTGYTGTIQLSSLGANGDKWGAAGVNAPNATVVIDSGSQLFVHTAASTFAAVRAIGIGNNEGRGAIRLAAGLTAPLTLLGSATIGAENGVLNGTITTGVAGTSTLTVGTTNSFTLPVNMLNGVISNGTGTLALSVFNQNGGTIFISGASANTYSGGTTLLNSTSGTRLVIGAISGTPYGTGAITIGAAATDLAGIYFTVANQTLANPLVVNSALGTDRPGIRSDVTGIVLSGTVTANLAAATFSTNGTGAIRLNGQLTGPQGLTLDNTFGTTITVTLGNVGTANNYVGNTNIVGTKGILVLAAANQIPSGAAAGNLLNSGTFNMGGFSEQINGLSGNGIVDGISGTPTLTVGDNNATGNTFSGIIRNTAGTLNITKIGSGIQTLSGANTYTGATSITGGILSVASLANGGSSSNIGASSNVAANLVLDGGTLQYTGATAAQIDRLFTLGVNGGTLDSAGAGVMSFTNAGSIAFTGSGARTLTLTGTNQGPLGGAAEYNATTQPSRIDSIIGNGTGGNVALTKTGTGVWVLTGANAYAGNVSLNQGHLAIRNSTALGTGAVNVADNAQLAFSAHGLTVNNNITLNGDTSYVWGAETLVGALIGDNLGASGGNTLAGTLTLAATSNLSTSWSDKSLTISGLITGAGGLQQDLYHAGNQGPLVILTRTAGANTYGVGTTINSGILSLGTGGGSATSHAGALSAGAVAVNSGAQLRLWIQDNASFVIANNLTLNGSVLHNEDGNYSLTGNISVPVTSTFSAKWTDKDLTITGPISGAGGVTVQNVNTNNGGAVIFANAANNYAGSTLVTNNLRVNGAITTTGAVTVNGTLGGTGSLAGAVTVNSSGSINPGNGGTNIGTLTVGSLTMNGGTYRADFNGNSSDTIATGGAIDLNGGTAGSFVVNSGSGTPSPANVFTLINNTAAGAITDPPLTGAAEAAAVTLTGTVGPASAIASYLGGAGANDFTLTVAGAVVLTLPAAGDYLVRQETIAGNNYTQLLQSGTVIDSRLAATVTSYTVNGSAGAESLTVSFNGSGGNPVPAGGLFWNGNGPAVGPGDSLTIERTAGYSSVVYNATGAGAGNFVFNGGALGTVTFTGLEPTVIVGPVTDVTINVDPGNTVVGAVTTTLTSGPGAGNNTASFSGGLESVQFANPSNSLTINGDNVDDDVITFTSLDAAYRAVTTITGQGGTDTVNVNAALTLGAGAVTGNLNVTAEAITLGANINTDAGTNAGVVNLTGAVTLSSTVVIDSDNAGTDGAVTVTGAINATAVGAQGLTVNAGTANVTLTSTVGATTALGALSVTGATISLGGNLSTDASVAITASIGTTLTASVTIDTESGDNGNAGAVTLTGPVAGNAAGRDVAINTNTAFAGGTGGAVSLPTLTTASLLNDLSINTAATTPGVTTLNGNVSLDNNGAGAADPSSFTIAGNGNIVLMANVTIDTESGTNTATSDANGGAVSFGLSQVSGNAAGRDLAINTMGLTVGGAITLGSFGNAGGAFINDLAINPTRHDLTVAGTVGIVTLGGNILLDDNGAADPASITINGNGGSAPAIQNSQVRLGITPFLIDTEQGNNGPGGSVSLTDGTAAVQLTSTIVGVDLTIDTSTTAAAQPGGAMNFPTTNNAGGQFLNDILLISGAGAGGTPGVVSVIADVLLDNNGADAASWSVQGGGRVAITRTLQIDTESGNNGPGGPVNLGTSPISATATALDLTIRTASTGAGQVGGAVSLAIVNNTGGQFLNDFTIDTDGPAGDGIVTLNGNVSLDNNGTADAAQFSIVGGGNIVLGVAAAATLVIDTESGNTAAVTNQAGVSFGTSAVSATNAGVNLSIDTSNTGAGSSAGNVTLAGFNATAGNQVNNLTVTANAAVTRGDVAFTTAAVGLGGNLSIPAADDVTQAAAAPITTVGTISITARNNVSSSANINAGASTITIAANQDGAGGEDFTQAVAGVSLTTTNDTASAVSITVGGTAGSGADAIIRAINAGTATLGRVSILVSGGAITDGDNDAATELTAFEALLSAPNGIGTSVNPFDITATRADVANSTNGGIFVFDTAGGLTLIDSAGDGDALAVSGVATNGEIRAIAGPLTISSDATTTGGMTYAATDTGVVSTESILINGAGTDVSDDVSLLFNAGDDFTLVVGTTLSAPAVAINVDEGDAESALPTAAVNDGGVLTIDGSVTTVTGTALTGGNDYDTFDFDPQTTTTFSVAGEEPHGTLLGDRLVMTIPLTGTTLTVTDFGSGAYSFPGLLGSVTFTSIEELAVSGGTYDLTINLNAVEFDDDTVADDLRIFRSGANVVIERTGAIDIAPALVGDPPNRIGTLYQDLMTAVNSLTIIGSTDNDSVLVDDVGGLIDFAGDVPALTGVGNNPFIGDTGLTTAPEFFFDAGLGVNVLNFNLNQASTQQQYAIGTGMGPGTAEGEVQSTNGVAGLNTYFRNVSEVNRTGSLDPTPGGLTVFGDNLANTINISADLVNPAESRVAATGYVPFDFSGDNYSALTVNALIGVDALDLISFGSGQTNDPLVTLNGGTEDDTLSVRSTSGNTGLVTLNGNNGNDLFQLFSSTNPVIATVDAIAGPVEVDGTDGLVANNTDTLVIVDSGDTDSDSVVISAVDAGTTADYSVNGINTAAGADVVFRNVDVLNYTGTSANDIIDGRFVNTAPAHDLNTVVLSGWLGADQFLLFTSDQKGGSGVGFTPNNTASGVATISLYGDSPGNLSADTSHDTFGETHPDIVAQGIMNVGLLVADTYRLIRPSASTVIAIDGGLPSGLSAPLGDVAGDNLNLDISALPNTTPVVVSTFSPGTVVALPPGFIAPITWTQIENMNLVDQGKLTNVQMGDLFARTTPQADLVQITRNPVAGNPNQVRLRLTGSVANYSASNKTIVYAGGMNDQITQSNLTIPAEFYGEGGDDVISGATNNDWLVGGTGNDRINGGRGDNVIWGDNAPASNDLEPQHGPDGGDDILSGLEGADVFYAGAGHDQVSAGPGNDYAYGGQGNDVLDGNDGDDRLYGGTGNDTISGHAGNDLLVGNDGDDKLYGTTGNDVLIGGEDADLVDGGDGNDLIIGGNVDNQDSIWTSFASTGTYSPATYTDGMDNDFDLMALLVAWGTTSDRTLLGVVTSDGDNDDLWGGTGSDDFNWQTLDVSPELAPSDYNPTFDERFDPT